MGTSAMQRAASRHCCSCYRPVFLRGSVRTFAGCRAPLRIQHEASFHSAFTRRRGRHSHATRASAGSAAVPQWEGMPMDETSTAPEGSAILAQLKGLMFYLWTLILAVPLFVTMLIMSPFVLLFDKHRRAAQHFVNNWWAKATTTPFFRVQVEGAENLPADSEAAVYVSNHQSFLDIFSVFHLSRSFKFVSKTSIFFIPIVGWSMFLTGHIKLNRMDKKSQLACLKECGRLLKLGCSVLFFPEGTRTSDGKMASFKKGAFSVAAKAGVPVVPITLLGTGKTMPNKKENLLYDGSVRIIVHPRVEPQKADEMLTETRDKIKSRLPPSLVHPQQNTR